MAASLLTRAFDENLAGELPDRALPVAAEIPPDLPTVIRSSAETIRQLLAPGSRQGSRARSIVRALANIEAAMADDEESPTDQELQGLTRKLKSGDDLEAIFPNVAGIGLASPEGAGRSEERRVGKEGRSRWSADH